MRRHRLIRWLLSASALLAVPAGLHSATRPNHEAARAFGIALQQDFAKRRSAAIIERVDEAALRRKVFSAYSPKVAEGTDAASTWKDALFPRFLDRLKALDGCLQLSFGRVLNVNGSRILEFVVVNKGGSIDQVYWDLAEGADGRIRITDQRMTGESLTYTKRTKYLLLLSADVPAVPTDEEELELVRASTKYHSQVANTLKKMREDKLDQAFFIWLGLPDDLQQTAIWQDMRMTMALRGSAGAIASVDADIRAGKPNVDPVLVYNSALRRQDYAAALAALDDVLARTYDSPLYRTLRCDLLTKMHRPKDSLQEATVLYRLNPYLFAGYVQAVHAAVAMEDFEAATVVLRDWSQVYAPPKIDEFLMAEPVFTKFRNAPGYRDWLNASPPITAP